MCVSECHYVHIIYELLKGVCVCVNSHHGDVNGHCWDMVKLGAVTVQLQVSALARLWNSPQHWRRKREDKGRICYCLTPEEVGGTLIGKNVLVVMTGVELVEWYQIHHTHGFQVFNAIPFAAASFSE